LSKYYNNYSDIKQIKQNKNYLIQSKIVYNKPKITNTLKTENNNNFKNSKYNRSTDLIEKINNIEKDSHNNSNSRHRIIEYPDDCDNINLEQRKKSLKNKSNKKNYFYNLIALNDNNEDNNFSANKSVDNNKEIFPQNFNNSSIIISKKPERYNRYSAKIEDKKKSFAKHIKISEEKHKPFNSERKIKEIIINKKMNKSNDDFDNLYSIMHYKTKTLLDNRKPIQVNLNMQRTFKKCHKDNYKLSNYLKNFNYNDDIVINNDYCNSSLKDKIEVKNKEDKTIGINYIKSLTVENSKKNLKQYDINTLHLNVNKNLTKDFQGINNSFEYNKNTKKNEKKINKENIYINNTFNKIINYNNFNKNTFDAKSRKKIYFKNKINTYTIAGNKIINRQKKIKEAILNKKEEEKKEDKKEDKKEEKNEEKKLSNKNLIFKKENVDQFQIVSKNKKQKENKTKNKTDKKEKRNIKEYTGNKSYRSNLDVRENNHLKKSHHLTRIISIKKEKNNRNLKNDNVGLPNTHHLFNSTADLKIGETFKNSIRNKYKRERSKK
jgi:hypothetical protein